MKKYYLILVFACVVFGGFAADDVEWNRKELTEADIRQITNINHKDYDKIIKLIKMGCLNRAQKLKAKLLKDIDSEKELSKNFKGKKGFDNFFRNIVIKRQYVNQKIKSHELTFLCNMYRQNKAHVEMTLDSPNNKKENKKTLINEIGKLSKYSKESKDCIYFPLTDDSKKDRNKIILAFIIKKILKDNNIKSEIIFTKGEKTKEITVVMPGVKKEIKYSSKEKMTDIIEKIMLIYYEAGKEMKKAKNKSFHNVRNPIFYPDDENIEKYLALRDKADLSIYLNSIDNISLTVKGKVDKNHYDIKSLKRHLNEEVKSGKLAYIFYCKGAHWYRNLKPEIEFWKSYFAQRGFDRLIIQLATSKKGVYILLDKHLKDSKIKKK